MPGGYRCGGVCAPANDMVLRGLSRCGKHDLAAKIARSKADFVGWTGLTPITVLIEYVLGIQTDVPGRTIHWHITNTERYGVENLRFGDRNISLICEQRSSENEKPVIHTIGCEGLRVEIDWTSGVPQEGKKPCK